MKVLLLNYKNTMLQKENKFNFKPMFAVTHSPPPA
jgi:hypothetical protein